MTWRAALRLGGGLDAVFAFGLVVDGLETNGATAHGAILDVALFAAATRIYVGLERFSAMGAKKLVHRSASRASASPLALDSCFFERSRW
jgi:hypothetical protein